MRSNDLEVCVKKSNDLYFKTEGVVSFCTIKLQVMNILLTSTGKIFGMVSKITNQKENIRQFSMMS